MCGQVCSCVCVCVRVCVLITVGFDLILRYTKHIFINYFIISTSMWLALVAALFRHNADKKLYD